MKKFLSAILLVSLLVMQFVLPVANASAETMTYDQLFEKMITRGNNVPSTPTSLPYTGSWNSVSNYTYTNYYFTGVSKIKVTLDVTMNYEDTAQFKVYLCNKTDDTKSLIIDSGSGKKSCNTSVTKSVKSSKKYYLEFRISGNKRSCSGSMKIEKG